MSEQVKVLEPIRMASTLLAIICLLITSCGEIKRREIARFVSPDSAVEAVLVGADTDATTSYTYELYVVPRGGELPDSERVSFVADHVADLQVRWREARFLEIQYRQARIHRFRNYWQSRDVDSFSYVVELRLQPQTESWSLSPRDRWKE